MKIKRQSLADEVLDRLKQKIKDGEYAIGDKLPTEPELMVIFGVGRSTIREAVRNLSHAGLVRVQQGLGTFIERQEVASESLNDRLLKAKGLELDEVRQLIELKIAEKAALNRTDEDIAEIRKHLEVRGKMAESNAVGECIQADISFHFSIAMAAKNEILLDLYRLVAERLKGYFMEIYLDTESFLTTQSMHEELLLSIVRKEPQKAWEWAAKITGQPH